jgi:hypothetical protein
MLIVLDGRESDPSFGSSRNVPIADIRSLASAPMVIECVIQEAQSYWLELERCHSGKSVECERLFNFSSSQSV